MNRTTRVLSLSLVTAAAFVPVALAVGCDLLSRRSRVARFRDDPFEHQEFDQTMWLESRGGSRSDNPRGLMAGDLRRRLLDLRPTRSEVLELLGPPDAENADRALEYGLGMWSGFRVDYDSLDVHFDRDDRVEAVWVVQH